MYLTGDTVKFLRQNVAKMTQRGFGHTIGYSYGYVCQVETGVYPITKRFETAVIQALELSEVDVYKYKRIMQELAK
ncbi:hypothetical protein QNH47_06260 [Virgibacillus halodenitrificans]|uniref:hypothetical protein n=1 Tax=Virgibacillus halodenitrificans TaxID=1482 RepID=UPI0024C01AD6|nr:hypothetical protein [Virgibacillus halodenitrificans]WHX27456.1 hypothetical protein QNH47_06260 [Virgibacillus halodenitrificans]